MGDRLRQTVGITTRYVLDPAAGLTQVLADGTNTYLYGNDRLAQYQTAMQYFGADALGSVRQIYDASAQVVGSSRYDPYGSVMAQSGATSVFAFTGEQQDATGLTYLRARYYSSAQGRFVTRDVWEGDPNAPMSYNAWLYTSGNPVNLTDPTGQCDIDQCPSTYNEWRDNLNKWLQQILPPGVAAVATATCTSTGTPTSTATSTPYPTPPKTPYPPYVQTLTFSFSEDARTLADAMWNEERSQPAAVRPTVFWDVGFVAHNCRVARGLTWQNFPGPCGFQAYHAKDPLATVENRVLTDPDRVAWEQALSIATTIISMEGFLEPSDLVHFINMDGRQLTHFPNLGRYSPDALDRFLNATKKGNPAKKIPGNPAMNFYRRDTTDLFVFNEEVWRVLEDAPANPPP